MKTTHRDVYFITVPAGVIEFWAVFPLLRKFTGYFNLFNID